MLRPTGIRLAAVSVLLGGLTLIPHAEAAAPPTTVAYQPMVSTGLAAGKPLDAWFVFDKSVDPQVPGYALPAGATIRFVFPAQFTPKKDLMQGAVLLYGWPQGPMRIKFTARRDPTNPRALVLRLRQPIASGPAPRPGLKAIHLRARLLNPAVAGDYPVTVTFANAGALSGTTIAVAQITPKPIPNIAAYDQLNHGRGENWQRVKAGHEASIPLDFLVTIPGVPRSVIRLTALANGSLRILSDGKPVGSIKSEGVPVTLTPVPFGPGFARLGIVRVDVRAGNRPGTAEIVAALDGGTRYAITLVVEASDKTSGR